MFLTYFPIWGIQIVKSILLLILVAIIFTVSLPSILANLASVFKNNGNTLVFFGTAFSGSLLVVKLIVVTQLFICVALTRDLFKLLPRLHLKGITQ